jgi:hypothetical protein
MAGKPKAMLKAVEALQARATEIFENLNALYDRRARHADADECWDDAHDAMDDAMVALIELSQHLRLKLAEHDRLRAAGAEPAPTPQLEEEGVINSCDEPARPPVREAAEGK